MDSLRDGLSELAETEGWMRSVVNHVVDGIITINDRGMITTFNPAAERIFGYKNSEIIGQNVRVLMPEPFHHEHDGYIANYLRTGEARIIGIGREVVGRRKSGATFPMEIAISVFQLKDRRYFTGIIRDITERKTAETRLQDANWKLEALIRAAPLGIYTIDRDLVVKSWNPAASRIFGFTAEEVIQHRLPTIPDDVADDLSDILRNLSSGETIARLETKRQRRDGKHIDVTLSAAPLANDLFMVIVDDMTDRNLLQQQLRQAQKMEALGRLASGIAHDFNNLLTVINGFSDIVREGMGADDPKRDLMDQIAKSGEKAALLTRQLLVFSRKQVVETRRLNVTQVINDIEKILRRLLGEDVDLTVSTLDELWCIHVDPGQIEQILMNLCINARDAMPQGGTITIEMNNVVVDDMYLRMHPGISRGEHVVLSVADSGIGMDAATQARIFEPFFTTKGPERGTGLGLATVFGIVNQCGGHIEVLSELGVGTTFTLYFPRCLEEQSAQGADRLDDLSRGGDETILLVEDEQNVRAAARMILESQGYHVLEAGNGDDALSVAMHYQGTIHILLTDCIMPRMSGPELAQRLMVYRPSIKTIFMSGYLGDIFAERVPSSTSHLLAKPFSPVQLARMVRNALSP